MRALSLFLIGIPISLFIVAYVAYPALLAVLSRFRPRPERWPDPPEWPMISLTVPSYNEEASIRNTLDGLLELRYPPDRRKIVVISDASTDRTDAIVREYASRGVELLRLPERRGKTAAENAAGAVVRGEIVVNIDATVRLHPDSLQALVRAFQDPTVGVASGRDVSVGAHSADATRGESGYVGYEMWVRSLETRLGSIVGASGCFYGTRRSLYDTRFPEQLSRDFASALIAREHGFRAVSVDDAICEVTRTTSLHSELRRKTRTMARGLETLWYKRHLMNPLRYGGFALMLIGHKLCRWLVYPALPAALLGVIVLSVYWSPALLLLALTLVAVSLGIAGLNWPGGHPPRILAVPAFVLAAQVAGVLAWRKVVRRERNPTWEPTRRPA